MHTPDVHIILMCSFFENVWKSAQSCCRGTALTQKKKNTHTHTSTRGEEQINEFMSFR